eukprot:g8577.t1
MATKRSVSGGRSSSDKEEASPGAAAAAADAAAAAAAAAAEGAPQEERTNYLVALAGMKALTSHVQDISKGRTWKERVKGWEEKAGLTEPSVKLALGFLDILGVSRASVYKQLLENSLRVLLDKIPHLEEKTMLRILNDSFRYATQAELKSVPLKIISSMSVVPPNVLLKINELQTHEPKQFEELGLPLAIKRLAWETDSKTFVRIASPHAEKYLASEFCPKMVVSSQQVRVYRSLDTIKRRKLMGPERIDALADCTGGRPILIGYLCDYIADRYKAESSLSQAGLWATLLTDVLVTARERAYGNIADQSVDRLCALASRLDLAVREDVFNDATVRDVQRLFRLATGIGEGQQEPTMADRREASKVEKAKHEDGSTKLQKTLKGAWSSVSKMDKNMWFKEPVTEKIAEGYHKIIKTPMDLGTILKKIKGGAYPSFGDFDRDLKLMWKNCRTYNAEGTAPHKEALKQEEQWSKMSTKIEDSLRQQEATPTATSNKRKISSAGAGSSQDDARRTGGGGGGGSGAPLAPMAPATQLDRQGLGRRVGLASILLSEPFVAKLMYRHASDKVPEACGERGMLPRDHPVFVPLLQLLDLGDYARPMFRAGTFGVRSVEDGLTRTVLPCVVALHARAEDAVAASRRRDGAGEAPAVSDAEKEEDAAAVARQDWRAWYKDYPVVRRMVCTMLCRTLVRGCDEAAALLMPAATVAVRRMADQRWLWATLGELLQKSADVTAAAATAAGGGGERGGADKGGGGSVGVGKKSGKERGAAARLLKPETSALILKLFSIGLESAAVSDAVFFKALDLVANLLPLASPPPPAASTTTAAATSGSGDTKRKPPPVPLPGKGSSVAAAGVSAGAAAVVALPRSALEDVVNQAAIRATRPTRRPRTEAEEEQIKEAFARVFARSPPAWASKLSEYRAKHAEKLSKKSAPEFSKPISIKGPKREREESVGAGGGGGGGAAGGASGGSSDATRTRKSRRVDV